MMTILDNDYHPNQQSRDDDGIGDLCDTDIDGDEVKIQYHLNLES